MNKFELISKTEYDKVVAEEFNAKNGVIGFQSYDQLQVPKRATKGSAGYDFISPISFKLKPGQTIKVPTCVKCCLSLGNVLMLFPRSSSIILLALWIRTTITMRVMRGISSLKSPMIVNLAKHWRLRQGTLLLKELSWHTQLQMMIM